VEFYQNVQGRNQKVIGQKYIDWEGCHKINYPHLDQALYALEHHGLRHIMMFKCNWNEEVIA